MPHSKHRYFTPREKRQIVELVRKYIEENPAATKTEACYAYNINLMLLRLWSKDDRVMSLPYEPPKEKTVPETPPEPMKCVAPTETACAYKRPAEAFTTEELLAELEKRYQSAFIVAETARGDYFIRIAGNKQQYELLLSLLGVKAERHFSGQPYTMEQRDAHLNRTVPGPNAGAATGVSRS